MSKEDEGTVLNEEAEQWRRKLKHDFLDNLTTVSFILQNARKGLASPAEVLEDLDDLRIKMERQMGAHFGVSLPGNPNR